MYVYVCMYVCMYERMNERTEKEVGTQKFPEIELGFNPCVVEFPKMCDEGESTVESRVGRTWVPSGSTGVDEASKAPVELPPPWRYTLLAVKS